MTHEANITDAAPSLSKDRWKLKKDQAVAADFQSIDDHSREVIKAEANLLTSIVKNAQELQAVLQAAGVSQPNQFIGIDVAKLEEQREFLRQNGHITSNESSQLRGLFNYLDRQYLFFSIDQTLEPENVRLEITTCGTNYLLSSSMVTNSDTLRLVARYTSDDDSSKELSFYKPGYYHFTSEEWYKENNLSKLRFMAIMVNMFKSAVIYGQIAELSENTEIALLYARNDRDYSTLLSGQELTSQDLRTIGNRYPEFYSLPPTDTNLKDFDRSFEENEILNRIDILLDYSKGPRSIVHYYTIDKGTQPIVVGIRENYHPSDQRTIHNLNLVLSRMDNYAGVDPTFSQEDRDYIESIKLQKEERIKIEVIKHLSGSNN